ncbi:hypothetical protein CTI14_70920, partial [Methylobacterium radiotolerans]
GAQAQGLGPRGPPPVRCGAAHRGGPARGAHDGPNSSVSEMVRKLKDLGLVDHRPYGAVRLTEEGRRVALTMVR